MPLLAALATLVASFVAGAILLGLGLTLIGVLVIGAGLLVAFMVWLMMATRL
jgi:hypothetical protein